MVLQGDSVLFFHASGYSDLQDKTPMTAGTSMLFYSVTKVFTAAAIMQLVHQGSITLDDSLHHLLDWAPYRTTLRAILTHTSGIPNAVIGTMFTHAEKDHATFDRTRVLRAACEKNPKLVYTPGKKMKYSNLGFALLGEVIESKSGKSYEEYIQENVFKPLEIDSTEISFSYADSGHLSKGYIRRFSLFNMIMGLFIKGYTPQYAGKWKTYKERWYIDCPAHGGAAGNSTGLSKFLRDVSGDSSKILPEPELNMMLSVQAPFRSSYIGSTDIGLGWFHHGDARAPYFFHEGSAIGYVTEIRIYPAQRTATLISMNTTDRIHKKILKKLDRVFLTGHAPRPVRYTR